MRTIGGKRDSRIVHCSFSDSDLSCLRGWSLRLLRSPFLLVAQAFPRKHTVQAVQVGFKGNSQEPLPIALTLEGIPGVTKGKKPLRESIVILHDFVLGRAPNVLEYIPSRETSPT